MATSTQTKVGITITVILSLLMILLLAWLLKKDKKTGGGLSSGLSAAGGGGGSTLGRDAPNGNTAGVQTPGGQPEIGAVDSSGQPVKSGTEAPPDAVNNYPDALDRADLPADAYDGPYIE